MIYIILYIIYNILYIILYILYKIKIPMYIESQERSYPWKCYYYLWIGGVIIDKFNLFLFFPYFSIFNQHTRITFGLKRIISTWKRR